MMNPTPRIRALPSRGLMVFAILFSTFLGTHRGFASGFGLGVRAGLPVAPVQAAGLELFGQFGEFSLGLSMIQGATDIKPLLDDKEDLTEINKAEAFASMTLLEARYFLFWGIYVAVGLGERQMGLRYRVSESGAHLNAIDGELKATSLIASHAFGMEWQFNFFYFGFQGIGHAYPISTETSTTTEISGNIAGDLGQVNNELDNATKEMGHVISKQLFLINFGVFF